jgi:hypothetical protein
MASSPSRRTQSNGPPLRRLPYRLGGGRIARFAARLGLAGILFQALLPLFLATASLTEAHAAPPDCADLGGAQSAIHPHHGTHGGAPAAPRDRPAGHSHGEAAHCILCLGLHAVGSLAVQAAIVLVPPFAASDTIVVALATSPQIARPPAPYASRAPPFIG